MVAIDGSHNGWRSLILPFSQSDALVMQAVVSVCTSHVDLNHGREDRLHARRLANFASGQGPAPINPTLAFGRVVSSLRQQCDLDKRSIESTHSVLMTLLVLLVGVMVNGRSDFPIILRMLESAITAIGGDEKLGPGPVADFIRFQARKYVRLWRTDHMLITRELPLTHPRFRAYAAPLLSEEQGKLLVSSPDSVSQLLACIVHRLPPLLECSLPISFILDLMQQAVNIYLEQVEYCSLLPGGDDNSWLSEVSITRVQHFKETLEAFPSDYPGEQVLIWASFVAASGCILDEHKRFFEGVFLRHHERSGFENVLAGLAHLRRIWKRSPMEKWTTLMANGDILVM